MLYFSHSSQTTAASLHCWANPALHKLTAAKESVNVFLNLIAIVLMYVCASVSISFSVALARSLARSLQAAELWRSDPQCCVASTAEESPLICSQRAVWRMGSSRGGIYTTLLNLLTLPLTAIPSTLCGPSLAARVGGVGETSGEKEKEEEEEEGDGDRTGQQNHGTMESV